MAYGLHDVVQQRRFIEASEASEEFKRLQGSKLDAMLALCEATDCRRVRLLAYSPETASMLPLLIHQAAQGHYEVPGYLARQMNEQLREILAMGMYTAVACTEDLDSFQKPAGQPDPLMLNANIRAMAQACRSWPRGEVPAGFDKQISPDIPVLALTGEFALRNLEKVTAQKAIMGFSGVSLQGGLTTSNVDEVAINEMMLRRATEKVLVVVESRKLGRDSTFVSGELAQISHLITDSDADPAFVEALDKRGIQVTLVEVAD